MPDRAEIEAVARALYRDEGGTKDGEIHWRYYETAEKVIEALDRVHDARGDDENPLVQRVRLIGVELHRSGAVEDAATLQTAADFLVRSFNRPARSPRGEDHEAGIEAALKVAHDGPLNACNMGSDMCETRPEIRKLIAAYLSRVAAPPPVRDARDDTTTTETPAGGGGYTLAALGTPPPDDDTDT